MACHEHAAEDQFEPRMAELVLLHSMYPHQLELDDPLVQAAVRSENVGPTSVRTVSGLFLVDRSLEVYFALSPLYPECERPTVHCRLVDGSLSKGLQQRLNDQVRPLVAKQDAGLIAILQMIVELWENRETNLADVCANPDQSNCDQVADEQHSNELCRYWIYSHHIKSKTKRKLIVDQCALLHLNGVMLIGKPGFICFEGAREDCDNLWSQVRRLTWQRISLIETETLPPSAEMVFDSFDEYSDRSALFHLLQSKGCDNVLKNFFGF